jgi:hypothetical protein
MNDKEGLPSAYYETPEAMRDAVEEFFTRCVPKPVLAADGTPIRDSKGDPVVRENPPTVSGLALYLGFSSRSSFNNYEKFSPEFADVIGRAKLQIEEYHERLLSIKDKCTGSIFWLKNHGWVDERTLSGGSPFRVASSEVKLSPEEEAIYRRNFETFFGPRDGGDARG